MIQYNDSTLMPFGEFKGQALVNVPASRLLYYYENYTNLNPSLKKYIESNLDVIKAQAKQASKLNRR
jgi:hypothetical protein